MLQRLRWPISALLSDDNVTKRSDRYLDLSNEQWVLAEELVKLLKPFEVATTFLCGEAQSIVSSTLPIIHGLTEYLEPDDADTQPIATFKQVVRDDIKQRWKLDNIDVSTCMVLSAVMDLRFRPLSF